MMVGCVSSLSPILQKEVNDRWLTELMSSIVMVLHQRYSYSGTSTPVSVLLTSFQFDPQLAFTVLIFTSLYIGTDPEETILNAFRLFDEDKKGFIGED